MHARSGPPAARHATETSRAGRLMRLGAAFGFMAAVLGGIVAVTVVLARRVESTAKEVGRRSSVLSTASAEKPAEGAPSVNPSRPPGEAPDGMVWVAGGTFWMGGNDSSTTD